MFRGKPRDPVVKAGLALRNIEDNVCFTSHEAWAWFVLPTQPWAFRSDTQREQLLFGFGDALSWLAGHRLHLRVTSRPYQTAEWARHLHQLTPDPLGTPGVEPWTEHLVTMQKHLRNQTMAEKEIFLGVRVANRAASHRLIGALWRHPGNIEHARLLSQVERVSRRWLCPASKVAQPRPWRWSGCCAARSASGYLPLLSCPRWATASGRPRTCTASPTRSSTTRTGSAAPYG
jgi:hypothetical protein